MKIAFIQAGGTIDKDYSTKKGTYDFHIDRPAFERILNRIRSNFESSFYTVVKKDSMDMDDSDRKNILDKCKKIKEKKIIITHGTDTMLKTAETLAQIQDKTIVITGASLPERFNETDADFNLGMSIGSLYFIGVPGIYVAMNGKVFPWEKCQKLDNGKFVDK